MNGEIPSVPITTLAGVSSLVDLLPEMPLPSPLPQTLGNKSLLFHPRVAEEAQRLLTMNDDNLIPQLIQSLSMTSSKHIELKDQYNELPLDHPNAPRLLTGIVLRKPDVFKGKQAAHPGAEWHNQNTVSSQMYGINNIPGIQQNPMMSASTGHMQVNPMDMQAQHHTTGLVNSDNMQMMSGLEFISGIPNSHAVKADRDADHGVMGYNCDSDNKKVGPLTLPGSDASMYSKNSPKSNYQQTATPSGYSTININHHTQQSVGHGHKINAMLPNQYPQSHPQPPNQLDINNSTKTSVNISHVPGDNRLAASTTAIAQEMELLQHGPSHKSVSAGAMNQTTFPSGSANMDPNSCQLPSQVGKAMSSAAAAAKINMSVPVIKIESNVPKKEAPSLNTAQPHKELLIKLDRENSEIQAALSRLEEKKSAASVANYEQDSRISRKSTGTVKTYREESSDDEEDADGRKNQKGKIFKTKDALKDKRKKRESKDSDYNDGFSERKRKMSCPAPEENTPDEAPKQKVRRVERMLVPVLEKLGSNVLDNSTYHRFLKAMDIVLESVDYADRNEIDLDEDGNVPSELLIPKSRLNELCSEAAKLKALGAMETIPSEKVVRLLTLLEINIRDGCKVTPLADPEDNDDESRLWLELTMESISRGVVSCLTALHILTSPNMPKRTYLEDLIDRIVIFSKYQLQNTVFPTFDPVYRVDKRGSKDGFGSNKKKRAHAREVREKAMLTFYTKMHEVVGLLAELLNVQVLTDTTVLHLSTLGVSPFFVENVSELQLSSLKLVTGIFTHYEKHRRLLLDDILASIARLPSSKRSLRTFKLSSGSDECIQMLTALVLQLIQCVTNIPDRLASKRKTLEPDQEVEKQTNTDVDMLISGRYDTALRIAGNFLAVFLSKCSGKSEDCDYRILFENFVQDLLSTVNKPEWPAAELLLSLLGNLLVKNLGNKNLEVSMRVASLEYLGVAAARLRKDAVSAQKKLETIDRIIADIRREEEKYGDSKKEEFDIANEEDKVEFLQRLLLDYLAVNGQSDAALMQSRHFYICSWWKNAQSDISKSLQQNLPAKPAKGKKKKKSSSSGEESETSELSDDDPENVPESEINSRLLQLVERRRGFLLTKIRPVADLLQSSRKAEVVQTYIDYQSAELITRYLASKKPFSASFDFFLTRILSVSTESTVAIRTKALKCLTMVVEADPSVLARKDMQMWVQHSFLDQSTAVREAAVDLVGKYVLSCPELIEKYYDILSLRILDTGVSVRKRVIKILRDVCVEHPTFSKIPEICVKMIRRVNDEDGIRKLVMEVFQNMWFTPVKEEPVDTAGLLRKVSNITEVVASCEKVGLDFFEQLLLSLFKPKEDKEDAREKVVLEPPKALLTACRQIVNCLVEHVLRLEENVESGAPNHSSSSQRFVACVATLYLFAKIRPQLLVSHAITLEGYLSLRCQNPAEVQAIANIAAILELVVPLLVNPSESFLSQLEEDCVKLLFRNDKAVIESCLACLGAVVNKITRNYSLVREVYQRFQAILFNQLKLLRDGSSNPKIGEGRPRIRRAIYTIGLILRYFDFTDKDVYGDLPSTTVKIIFSELIWLIEQDDVDLEFFSLQAVGNLCIRHFDYMLGDELKRIYQNLLTAPVEIKLKTQALYNIQLYLTEEELRMIKQDQEWQKNAKRENIKEMGDVSAGMASTIVQIYLKEILEGFLHRDLNVRRAAVRVVQLVLQQGLVHPIQIVPYLICMSTDEEPVVATTADKQLQEMEKKHPQFLQSQVLKGIKLSLQLQRILAGYCGPISALVNATNQFRDHMEPILESSIPVVRGYRMRPKEAPVALNGFLYSLLRSTKPQRRAIVLSLLKQFDDQNKTRLADLLYYCDNLAYFPYQVVDEPLFIIHHVDIIISVSGSNVLQAFKESLLPLHTKAIVDGVPVENGDANYLQPGHIADDDDEDDDVDVLLKRIPEDTKTLEDCIIGSQGCLLLLMLKQHLKETYGITDSRISGYSPSDATKTFERPVNRRNAHIFDPKCTLANLKSPPSGVTPEGRRAIVEQYIHFKQLMLKIDPEEGDEDGDTKPIKLKIDQNLFTYSNAKPTKLQQSSYEQSEVSAPTYHSAAVNHNSSMHTVPVNQTPQYVVVSNTPAKQVEQVRIPKLKIVPLAFPGNDASQRKSHKVKDHHHKHKKSKHKKKKRHAISDDSDSDNSDDPDFRL